MEVDGDGSEGQEEDYEVPDKEEEEEGEQAGYFFNLTKMGIGYVFAGENRTDGTVEGTWGGETGRFLDGGILVNQEKIPVDLEGEELGTNPLPVLTGESQEDLSQLFVPPSGGNVEGNLEHLMTFLDQQRPDFEKDAQEQNIVFQGTNTKAWEQGKQASNQEKQQARRLYEIAMSLTSAAVKKYQEQFNQWRPQQLQEIVILYFFCRMSSFLLQGDATQGFSTLLSRMAERVYTLMG